MSQFLDRLPGHRSRHWASVAIAVLAVGVLGAAGTLIDAKSAEYDPGRIPAVGRTRAVCTVVPSTKHRDTTVGAAVMRQAPGRAGVLTGRPINSTKQTLEIKEQGMGEELTDRKASLLFSGEGVMATASSGTVLTSADSGDDQGISAAPCTAPAVDHWFTGVGYSDDFRSELILTNVDETQAEVDLRFFGEKGQIVVPGGQGMVVPAGKSVTVALESLIDAEGPLSVAVHSSDGRVAAIARDQRSTRKGKPAGADWHTSSINPRQQVIIPGVPEGEGERYLYVTNPGTTRTTVQVEVLGADGPYSPVGAESLELEPESSGSVRLEEALSGEAAGIRLTSDHPITGSVGSVSVRGKADDDIAFTSAGPPVTRNALAGAALIEDAESNVVLSNNGADEVTVSLQLVSYSGQTLYETDVPMLPGTSDSRKLREQGPGYLVVKAPDGSDVYAGLTMSQPEGDIAGLTTPGLVSPDLASRAPEMTADPGVAR